MQRKRIQSIYRYLAWVFRHSPSNGL